MTIYTLRGGTSEGREADEALVELRAEIGASLLAREIRSIADSENFEDSQQFSDFCREYQVTENAKEALINLLHVLGQLGSLSLVGPGGSLEVSLMVRYTLRDSTRNRPVTEEDMLVHQVGVNPFVGLRARSGRGASVVEKIRSIASLTNFDLPSFDEFCQQYQVQVTDEQVLKSLLRDLTQKDLILEDPDFDEPWDVRKLEGGEFS